MLGKLVGHARVMYPRPRPGFQLREIANDRELQLSGPEDAGPLEYLLAMCKGFETEVFKRDLVS
jgi:hypothetical protein